MLSVLVLAYRGRSLDDASRSSVRSQAFETPSGRRQHIFQTYIERMLEHKGRRGQPYAKEPTKMWLSWLAAKMSEHSQTVFLIEQLQLSWLATRTEQALVAITSHLIGGLTSGLILALMLGVPFGPSFGLSLGLSLGAIWGLIGAVSAGLSDVPRQRDKPSQITHSNASKERGISLLLLMSMLALTFALIFGLSFGLIWGVIAGPIVAVILSPFFWLLLGKRPVLSDFETVEILRWSWASARKSILSGGGLGLLMGFSLGLTHGVIWGLSEGQSADGVMLGLRWGLSWGLVGGLAGGLIGVTFGGLKSSIDETKTLPNQGIKLSIRNALFGGVIGVLSGGLMAILMTALIAFLSAEPSAFLNAAIEALPVGLSGGLVAALPYGGWHVIQHVSLRLILYCKGYTPRNYAHFLDYAAKLIFLQKVGGGYIFIHRLLLEHLAAMGDKEA